MKSKITKNSDTGCCNKPDLKSRPLLSPIQAGGLAAVFKVLANDTRLRLLHASGLTNFVYPTSPPRWE